MSDIAADREETRKNGFWDAKWSPGKIFIRDRFFSLGADLQHPELAAEPAIAVGLVVHEGRHELQDDLMRRLPHEGEAADLLGVPPDIVLAWNVEMPHPKSDFDAYEAHPREVDARDAERQAKEEMNGR